MHFKRRGNRISLYRSLWVPKGPDVSHGHSRQTYVGSIELDAVALPPELAVLLTSEECDAVERRIIAPALMEREAAIVRARRREVDPAWRLHEAVRLVNEAAVCSQTSAVAAASADQVKAALEKVKIFGPAASATPVAAPDTLRDALKALSVAADAVRQGKYGSGPQSGFRKTSVFRQWTAILAAVDGGERSLLRALQDAGFASRRKA